LEVQAKIDFESMDERLGVKIYNYHAQNGKFASNSFVQYSKTMEQGLT
jgi:hypothetical protein